MDQNDIDRMGAVIATTATYVDAAGNPVDRLGRPIVEADILPFRSIGEVADEVVREIGETTGHQPAVIDAGYDPVRDPPLIRLLRSVAHNARDRRATVTIIRAGFLVQASGKSEIVGWDEAAAGVLDRALERVSPHEWEVLGMDPRR